MNYQVFLPSVFLLSGCATLGYDVPVGADSLPYYHERVGGVRVRTAELCRLYFRHEFVQDAVDCDDSIWQIDYSGENLIARRNAMQHEILGVSTDRCNDFKIRLQARPRNHLLTARSVALILTGAAAANAAAANAAGEMIASNAGRLTAEYTAGAAAVAAFGQILAEAYPDDIQTALLGIELARTDIFMNIRDVWEDSLAEYPLTRAVNDALRYHSVCNLEEGYAAASRATNNAIEAAANGDNEDEDDQGN